MPQRVVEEAGVVRRAHVPAREVLSLPERLPVPRRQGEHRGGTLLVLFRRDHAAVEGDESPPRRYQYGRARRLVEDVEDPAADVADWAAL